MFKRFVTIAGDKKAAAVAGGREFRGGCPRREASGEDAYALEYKKLVTER
jgi:hypothetical protein